MLRLETYTTIAWLPWHKTDLDPPEVQTICHSPTTRSVVTSSNLLITRIKRHPYASSLKATFLDLFLDENKLFNDVEYQQVTDYAMITSGKRSVQLRPSNDNDLILAEEYLELEAGTAYTVYAVGLNEGIPPLKIIYFKEELPVVNKKEAVKKEMPKEIKTTSGRSSVKIIFRYV